MPNRILRESICTSESVNSMDWFEEVLFYRILVNCDDYGRMDARPAILKAWLFPLKEELSIEELMQSVRRLADSGVIVLYEVNDHPYLYVPTWEKYQKIRTQRSKYPAPIEEQEQAASSCKHLFSDVCLIQSNPNQSESESESKSESKSESESESESNSDRLEDGPIGEQPTSREARELGSVRVLCSEVISVLNAKAHTQYRPFGKRTMHLIGQKLKQGYTREDLLTVLDKKAQDWLHPRPGERDMRGFYRPETLFGDKFESYLNQPDRRMMQPQAASAPVPRYHQQTASSLDLAELEQLLARAPIVGSP